MPKVSVIIPCYNHARFLAERMKSIYSQTFTDYEIIFLDDASTDDSVDIYKSLRNDKCVIELFNRENCGYLSRQWNRGLAEASGQYVWIAESDDWSDTDFLYTAVEIMDDRPRAGMFYCRSNYADERGNIINGNSEWAPDIDSSFWENDFIMDGERFASEYLVLDNVVNNTSACLIRKSVLDALGPLDESVKYCGDWILWARIAGVSDIAYSSRRLNYYRHCGGSVRYTSMRSYEGSLELYRVFRYICNNFNVIAAIRETRLERLCRETLGKIIYNASYGEAQKLKMVSVFYDEVKQHDDALMGRIARNMAREYAFKIINKCVSVIGAGRSARKGGLT